MPLQRSSKPYADRQGVAVLVGRAEAAAPAALADVLGDQAERLRSASVARDIGRMRFVLIAVHATCRSCHERFRDISGGLPGNP